MLTATCHCGAVRVPRPAPRWRPDVEIPGLRFRFTAASNGSRMGRDGRRPSTTTEETHVQDVRGRQTGGA
jgi:hypothetical protein